MRGRAHRDASRVGNPSIAPHARTPLSRRYACRGSVHFVALSTVAVLHLPKRLSVRVRLHLAPFQDLLRGPVLPRRSLGGTVLVDVGVVRCLRAAIAGVERDHSPCSMTRA